MSTVHFHAEPFRYAVIENFAPKEQLEEILSDWPERGWVVRNSNNTRRKRSLSDRKMMPWSARLFLKELNSVHFRRLIQEVLHLESPLLPDEALLGGGLHEVLPGGFLKVHVDFNQHPQFKLKRKVNVLLYLNEEWGDDWGGELEIWDVKSKRCVERIKPAFNRAVAFECSETSFHGHPEPLASPVSRKSIAVYYYCNEPVKEKHNTIYMDVATKQFESQGWDR